MKSISWKIILVIISLSNVIMANPTSHKRVKREDEIQLNDQESDLNPIDAEESADGLDREKRKLPEATFAAKNAVLGFVFGKIDNLIDSKTRFIEQLDKTNIEKNKQYNIKSPPKINDFQTLVTAVVSPKIQAITQAVGSITTGVLGGLSGGGGGSGSGGAVNGLGNILSKFLSLSGPILQGSSGGGGSGGGGSSGNGGTSISTSFDTSDSSEN